MHILKFQPWWVWALVLLPFVFVLGAFWYKQYIRSITGGTFQVVSQTKIYEIRAYESIIVAQVELEDLGFRSGSNAAFQILAGYIFGNNESKKEISMTAPVLDEISGNQKIAMTTPVLDEVQKEGKRIFSFLMPRDFTLDTLPIPKDDRILLKEIPARTMAVISFRGTWSEAHFTQHYKTLIEALKTDGIQFSEGFTRASYDPPITPSFLRTNEILILVTE